jgi:hypothetical protein
MFILFEKFLLELFKQIGWPAPGLNIIENELAKTVRVTYRIKSNILLELICSCPWLPQKQWENIQIKFIKELYHSIPRKLNRVIRESNDKVPL